MATINVAVIVSEAIRQLQQADLRLLNAPPFDSPVGPAPFVFSAAGFSARLSLGVRVSSKSVTFFFFTDEEQRSVANLRLSLSFQPSPDPDPITLGFSPRYFLSVPSIIQPTFVPGKIVLRHDTLSEFHITPQPRARDTEVYLFSGGAQSRFKSLETFVSSPKLQVLLDLWASWRKTPSRDTLPIDPHHVHPSGKPGVRHLLRESWRQFEQIASNFAAQPRRSTLPPPLNGSHYFLSSLEAKILVQLDQDGHLANEADQDSWHQVDLSVTLDRTAPEAPEIHHALLVPDILNFGYTFQFFLKMLRRQPQDLYAAIPLISEKVRKPAGSKKKGSSFRRRPVFSVEFFLAFLENEERETTSMFVRLSADDTDLIMLSGTHQGVPIFLTFVAQFTHLRPYPEVVDSPGADLRDIRFLTGQVGARPLTGDKDTKELVAKYFNDRLIQLRDWQEISTSPS